MKSTKVQTLGAPMCMRSLAHNNYLLLGVVTQHVESRSIREVQKDGLKFRRGHVKTEANISCYLI